MSFIVSLMSSIAITALMYLAFAGTFVLGGWIANNRNKKRVKYLNNFLLFVIWCLTIQILKTLGYLQI